MKKFLLLSIFFTQLYFTSNATTHVVEVTNNQFSPSNILDVFVGDVVSFHFIEGFHNAISTGVTNGVPAGAAPINSGDPSNVNPRTYNYTVTEAGTYKYVCQVH